MDCDFLWSLDPDVTFEIAGSGSYYYCSCTDFNEINTIFLEYLASYMSASYQLEERDENNIMPSPVLQIWIINYYLNRILIRITTACCTDFTEINAISSNFHLHICLHPIN